MYLDFICLPAKWQIWEGGGEGRWTIGGICLCIPHPVIWKHIANKSNKSCHTYPSLCPYFYGMIGTFLVWSSFVGKREQCTNPKKNIHFNHWTILYLYMVSIWWKFYYICCYGYHGEREGDWPISLPLSYFSNPIPLCGQWCSPMFPPCNYHKEEFILI